jgi:hypothetical protein
LLNSKTLREVLKSVFGIEDKYLVPISTNWFIPTIDPEDKVGSWIGYRIMSKKPYVRAYQQYDTMVKPIKVSFRLTFVGPEAERLADQVLLWEDRTDVQRAFEEVNAQINYTDRTSFTYPIRNGGFNDDMCWIVDLSAQTFYEVNTKQGPWIKGN